MSNKTVLLEIGVEEVPARFIPSALRILRELAETGFNENALSIGDIQTYATPRRLALVVRDVPPMQPDRIREAFGPPTKAAFTPDGKLTKAGEGFARSVGIEPSKLVIKAKDKGEYVVAVVEDKGRPTAEVLPDILKKIVLSLHFPKAMRWGDGTMKFVRPIHWIAALYGADAVTFEIENITSSRISRGHRFLAPDAFEITTADAYVSLLEEHSVIVDKARREDMIAKGARELAKSVGGTVVEDEELLSIVACLVEYPVPVMGTFSPDYLDLPDELLTAVMRGHQKYFSIADSSGKLLNHFIITSNTRIENAETVRAGAHRVIKARFDDARFYYHEDAKHNLTDRINDLKKVTFQDKLGSLYDKAMRMERLAGEISDVICPASKDKAMRAALLSKCDLISGVVREFPELQGIMGMYYAKYILKFSVVMTDSGIEMKKWDNKVTPNENGEDDAIATALMEQYMPLYSGAKVPATELGCVLSLADRIDNIAAFFSIGLKPTGSEDPFALRRHALSVIAILMEKGYSLTIMDMVRMAKAVLPAGADIEADIKAFFEQRFEPLLGSMGYTYDVVQSVLPYATTYPLSTLKARCDAVVTFKREPWYTSFLIAIKRARNIIPDHELPKFWVSSLTTDEERALYQAFDSTFTDASRMASEGRFSEALLAMKPITEPINLFFEKVLVMDKNEAVRNTRLALLQIIWAMTNEVADLSKLQE